MRTLSLGVVVLVGALWAGAATGQGNVCAKSAAPPGSPAGAVVCTCTCAQGAGRSSTRSMICNSGKCGPCDCAAPANPKPVCG